MTNYHLVILKKPYLDAILAGRKTVESRFSKTKHRAFQHVLPGDRLFLKLSSGPVCAIATVAAVKYFENLTREKILQLKKQYNHAIKGSDQIWESKSDCRFGFLVWLKDVKPTEPVRIDKKDWRAWVVLTKEKDFGLREKFKAGFASIRMGSRTTGAHIAQANAPKA